MHVTYGKIKHRSNVRSALDLSDSHKLLIADNLEFRSHGASFAECHTEQLSK
jgi:hypothetical protein